LSLDLLTFSVIQYTQSQVHCYTEQIQKEQNTEARTIILGLLNVSDLVNASKQVKTAWK